MNRAYSVLEIRGLDDEKREVEGIATTPATDMMDDVVEPKGAEFKLPIPFLSQHDPHKPIGHVTKAKVTKDGIFITARLVKPYEGAPQSWADRLNESWADIKSGLVRGLSIGFRPLETARIEGSFGTRFIRYMLLELSSVTIAANQEATVTAIKSMDMQLRAASGGFRVVHLDRPVQKAVTPTKKGVVYL